MTKKVRIRKSKNVAGASKKSKRKVDQGIKPASFFKSIAWGDRRIELLLLEDKKPKYFVGDWKGVRENSDEIRSSDAVFFGLNPSSVVPAGWNEIVPGSIGRTNKSITGIRTIYIDVDPVRPADTCATKKEKRTAKIVADKVEEYLTTNGFPTPWVVDSGNGYHLYFHCDLDVKDADLVKQLLASLASKFDTTDAKVDRNVGDVARLCRMPGTFNRKGDDTAKRPHRKCHIVKAGGDTIGDAITRELLEELLPQKTVEARPKLTNSPKPVDEPLRPDVVARVSNYVSKMPPSISGNGGHDRLYAAACKTVELGCNRAEARSVIDTAFNPRCEPPWSPEKIEHKLDAALQNTSPDTDTLVAEPDRRIGDPNFFGFVPDWADIYNPVTNFFNPLKEEDLQTFLLEHFLLMQFLSRKPTVPQEFIRQFYFTNPFQKNWRSRLPKKISRKNWRTLDTFREPRQFPNCLHCSLGFKAHTHIQVNPQLTRDLEPFFVVKRDGKLFFDDQRKDKNELGIYVGKEPALHTRPDSFLHFRGRNKERNSRMRSKGIIRKAYWPTLLFGWQAGLDKFAIRALLGITNELTRVDGSQLVFSNTTVPLVRTRKGSCPELEANSDYIVFGGNREVAKGQGYALFGRTNEGWIKRLGLGDAYKVQRKSWRMYVAKFVFDSLLTRMIPQEFQLTVAGYHSGKNEWKGLDELRRASRSETGFDWIDKATIRFYAPADWNIRWRAYLSQRLGYSWIPGSSSECHSTLNSKFITPAELSTYIKSQGITQKELADRLTRLARQKVSTKKIQRFMAGTTQTPEFGKLLTDLIRM